MLGYGGGGGLFAGTSLSDFALRAGRRRRDLSRQRHSQKVSRPKLMSESQMSTQNTWCPVQGPSLRRVQDTTFLPRPQAISRDPTWSIKVPGNCPGLSKSKLGAWWKLAESGWTPKFKAQVWEGQLRHGLRLSTLWLRGFGWGLPLHTSALSV